MVIRAIREVFTHAVPVRQAGTLPPACFGFAVAPDTPLLWLEHFSFFCSRLHRQAFASLARAMILAKEAGDGGMPMARTARAAFTKSSPVPVWLQYFEKCSKLHD